MFARGSSPPAIAWRVMAVLWLLCLFGLAAPRVLAAPGSGALDEAERAWVAAHPVVRIGVSTEFPPYYFADERGRYEGFVIDLMDRLAAHSGLRLEYRRFVRVGDVLAALRAGEIDATPFLSESGDRQRELRFVRPLFSTQMVFVTDRRLGDVSPDLRFSGYRVAVERASTAADLMHVRFPQATLKEYDTSEQALLAAASGDADVFVGFRQVAVYFMEKHLTANLVLRGTIETPGTALGPAVRKDLPELAAILDKAVNALTTEEITEVAARWLPRALLGAAPKASLQLTPAQQAWVKDHPGIRLGFDAGFAPIAFENIAGGFDGLAADITRTLAARIGLIVAYERGGTFADVFDRARRGELDIVAAAGRNAERGRDFDFVGPFLRVPTVIVAASDREIGAGLDAPGSHRLALLRQHFLIPQLRSRHPNLVLVPVDTQAEALEAVRGGRADFAIGNMKVVNPLLERLHTGALRVVGVVPQGDSELYFAVRKSLPELAPILRVALDTMTPEELAAIENRWVRVDWSAGVPWQRVAAFGAAAALVVSALWFGNRRLRSAQRALAEAHRLAEAQVAARAGFTAYLSHELRGTLGGLAGGLALLGDPALPAERARALVEAMGRSAAGLLALCERTLDFERAVQGGVDLQIAPARLGDVIEQAATPWRVQAELKGLALRLETGFAPGFEVTCDAVRLTQVLQNLIGNAVKFTARGEVSIRAELSPAAGDRAWLSVRVGDAGPGIPDAERAGLFTPFAQGEAGRRTGGGAGLGLSISAHIVEAMEGTLAVESTSAQGSTFLLRIPVAVSAPLS